MDCRGFLFYFVLTQASSKFFGFFGFFFFLTQNKNSLCVAAALFYFIFYFIFYFFYYRH